MKIAPKLLLAFLSVAAVTALAGFFSLQELATLESSFAAAHDDNAAETRVLVRIRQQCLHFVIVTERYLAGRDPAPLVRTAAAHVAEAVAEYARSVRAGDRAETLVSDGEPQGQVEAEVDTLALLRRHERKLDRTAHQALERPLHALEPAKAARLLGILARVQRSMNDVIDEALKREATELHDNARQIEQSIHDVRRLGNAAVASVLLIAIALALGVSRSMGRALGHLTTVADAIATGDLLARASVRSADEIGSLGTALNRMADALLSGRTVQRERDHLNAVMRAMSDSLVVVDGAGRIQSANAATFAMVGRREEELENAPITALIADGTLPLADPRGGPAAPEIRDLRATYHAKDGIAVPVSLSWSPLLSSDGTAAGAVVVARDMRETLALITALETARDAAQFAERAKSDFLATVSHEIRTPLNGIFGMTELALDTEDDGERRYFLTRARACSESLLAVINDVLDCSKMEAGKLDLERIEFDPRDVLSGVLDTLALEAKRRDLELIGFTEPELSHRLLGDPGRLRQIVLNLANNALKFTERGEVVVRIERVGGSGPQEAGSTALICFTVQDTGIGIPTEKLEHIFEAFTQADSSDTRRYGGTGLGLTIARRLVRLMGGDIEVVSAIGEGSTFRFTVPFECLSATTPKHAPQDVAGYRILVVDDNATNRAIMLKTLEAWGCRVALAASGLEACDLLLHNARVREPFDLVLLDVQMPELDGVATARRIRREPLVRDVAVVLLTSVTRSAPVDAADLRITATLPKPIKAHELRSAIAECIRVGPVAARERTRRLRLAPT